MNTREMLFVRHAITISEHYTLTPLLLIASRVLFVPLIDPLRPGSTSIHMGSQMKQRARRLMRSKRRSVYISRHQGNHTFARAASR